MARWRWRELATELKSATDERPHLEWLRARVDVACAQEQLEREVVREMAAALGRTAEKVASALAELQVARVAVEAAASEDERTRAVARFNERRCEALRARHELVIHREAIGIRRNDVLESVYPIPAPLGVGRR